MKSEGIGKGENKIIDYKKFKRKMLAYIRLSFAPGQTESLDILEVLM